MSKSTLDDARRDPPTNRKAKRQRCKARRRLRLSNSPLHCDGIKVSPDEWRTPAETYERLIRSSGRRGGKTYASMLEIDS